MTTFSLKWNTYTKTAFCVVISALLFILSAALFGLFNPASAEGRITSDEHLVTIYDRGVAHSLITKKDTLRKVLADEGITLDKNDIVEPNLDDKLVAKQYEVNIYRARPVTIIDGAHQVRVMSAYQTPKQIAKQAGIALRDEDEETLGLPTDLVSDGASIQMVIKRATPVQLIFYGKTETVYTQKTTIGDFLKDKDITLQGKDRISLPAEAAITPNMRLEIWREGVQTQTRNEPIKFTTREIQDANQPVGYRKVQTEGVNGEQTVTYKVTVKNGKTVKRKALHRVVIKKAVQEVVVVGAKPSFSGDFAAALAKLRSCEGSYTSWNPAGPYYGAYQFDQGTWNGVSSAPYGHATPAEQDAAAHALYMRRGWSPWPVCGAGLPDTYR